jgi:hypothetical protein
VTSLPTARRSSETGQACLNPLIQPRFMRNPQRHIQTFVSPDSLKLKGRRRHAVRGGDCVAYVQRSDLVLGKGGLYKRERGGSRKGELIWLDTQHFPSQVNPSAMHTHTYAHPASVTSFTTCFQDTQYTKHPHLPSPKPPHRQQFYNRHIALPV